MARAGRWPSTIARVADPWLQWARGIPHRSAVLYSFKASFAAGTAILAVLAAQSLWWLFGVIPCAVLTVLIEAVQGQLAAQEVATTRAAETALRRDFAEVLNGALVPIGAYLGHLSPAESAGQRKSAVGTLRQKIVDAAVEIVNEAKRSAYYELTPEGRLLRKAFSTRTTEPRREFTVGSTDYDAILATINGREAKYIPDVAVADGVMPTPGSGYRSVVRVAVSARERGVGVLTVDSPKADGFADWEVTTMKALASLLGAGTAWVLPRGG